MKVLLKVDWNVLNTYIDNKKILANKHPEYDIWILNYSKDTQFERTWDIYTLSCRGLVIDAEGNVLARPYKKFFNYEEVCDKIDMNRRFEAYEKMDGSLIILFYYAKEQKWIVASRGSFISKQAVLAQEILNKYNIENLNKTNTYVFELISKFNRIVVNYSDVEDLVLLGCIDTKTGEETSYDEMCNTYKEIFPIVKRYFKYDDVISIADLKLLEEDNREGFVVRFENGERIKIKFKSYVKLHGIVTNLSSKDIWKCLCDGIGLDNIINIIPDEYFMWVKKWEKTIKQNYNNVENCNLKIFNEIMSIFIERDVNLTNKDFALINLSIKEGDPSIRFRMFQNKKYDDIIWKLIEPDFEKMFIVEHINDM